MANTDDKGTPPAAETRAERAARLIRLEIERGEQRWHWLSFADGKRPAGTQFLGAVLIRAPGFLAAVQLTHMLGLNPGGEVKGIEADEAFEPPPGWANRLLTRAECEEFDRAIQAGNGG